MRIYHCFPQPAPVTLGGRECYALPFRLRHLAAIEQFLANRVPCPAAKYAGLMAMAEGDDERKVIAAQAFLRTEAWPPRVESDLAQRLLMTPLGLDMLLGYLVEPCTNLSAEDRAEIIAKISIPEFGQLMHIGYGAAVLDTLATIIDPPRPDTRPPRSWGEILWDVSKGVPSDLLAAGELFVTQLKLIQSKGLAGEGHNPHVGAGYFDAAIARRAVFVEAEARNAAEDAADGDE